MAKSNLKNVNNMLVKKDNQIMFNYRHSNYIMFQNFFFLSQIINELNIFSKFLWSRYEVSSIFISYYLKKKQNKINFIKSYRNIKPWLNLLNISSKINYLVLFYKNKNYRFNINKNKFYNKFEKLKQLKIPFSYLNIKKKDKLYNYEKKKRVNRGVIFSLLSRNILSNFAVFAKHSLNNQYKKKKKTEVKRNIKLIYTWLRRKKKFIWFRRKAKKLVKLIICKNLISFFLKSIEKTKLYSSYLYLIILIYYIEAGMNKKYYIEFENIIYLYFSFFRYLSKNSLNNKLTDKNGIKTFSDLIFIKKKYFRKKYRIYKLLKIIFFYKYRILKEYQHADFYLNKDSWYEVLQVEKTFFNNKVFKSYNNDKITLTNIFPDYNYNTINLNNSLSNYTESILKNYTASNKLKLRTKLWTKFSTTFYVDLMVKVFFYNEILVLVYNSVELLRYIKILNWINKKKVKLKKEFTVIKYKYFFAAWKNYFWSYYYKFYKKTWYRKYRIYFKQIQREFEKKKNKPNYKTRKIIFLKKKKYIN